MILGVQVLRRQPLKTQEAPKRLSLASRGHLEPSWSHLENKSLQDSSGQKSLCPVIAVWLDFGDYFGAQNWPIFGNFRNHFLDQILIFFSIIFGAILGTILGPDRHRKTPRWDQEGHQELQRPKKLYLQKLSKLFSFLRFLGSKGLPREP